MKTELFYYNFNDFLLKLSMTRTIFPKKAKNRTGPKGHFEVDFLRQVYLLSVLGARDVDYAEFFKVHITTIDYWKTKKPDFMAAMSRGKTEFDMKVAEKLGQRALGYEATEVEISEHLDKMGNIIQLKKVTRKQIAPDVTAQIFWLKNRQRHAWVDVNRTEVSANINIQQNTTLNLESLTDQEKELIRSISIKKLASTHGVSNN